VKKRNGNGTKKKLLKLQRDNERQQQLFNRRLTELEHQKIYY